ncbi:MAG: oligopeptidase A [Gammaproteobacteria bacterium]|nr:oligopeptidase A [Gammaproteobacteria bacterium]
MSKQNSLLAKNQFPVFSTVKPRHVLPALEQILTENRATINRLLQEKNPSWENLIQPLEELDDRLHTMWGLVSHLNAVVNSSALRKVYNAVLPQLSAYFTELGQNTKLYKAINKIAASPAYKNLTIAQKKIIANELRDFKLSGVALSPRDKQQFAKLQTQLAALSAKFSENLLDATCGWARLVTNKKELTGIPKHALQLAKAAAKTHKKTGWMFTLEQPSYLAVIAYADNHNLRQEIYTAYVTRASDQGPNAGRWDNSKVMADILQARTKEANLLKFDNYAEYSLAPKMARTPKQVLTFLRKLAKCSHAKAKQEFAELQKFAQEQFSVTDLQPWDLAYYSEKLRQHQYSISQEDLRPYFPEPQVLTGMFKLVKRLYGITVTEVNNLDVWHQDVKVFALHGRKKNLISYLYMDLYARPQKQGSAWMNDYCGRRKLVDGNLQLPIAYIICNFSAPIGKRSALFTHSDVLTLFHEFGHSLQHMLTKVDYAGVAGINGVPWDAVELPSQFMENWCFEKSILNLIAKHYKTGKPLPKKLYDRMIAAKNFQTGLQMLRQLEFSLFDFRLHMEFDAKQKNQIQTILDSVRKEMAVTPQAPFNRFQHGFSHIFGGGYAAGYYSYKWAEVLASDAFAKFQEDGLFNKETAASFLHNILEAGGAVDPMILFKRFRGRAPKIDALLQQCGVRS